MRRKTRTSSRTTDPDAAVRVALALGSNLGEPERHLAAAVNRLSGLLDGLCAAPLFRSKPEASADQPDYWNTAVVGRCRQSAEDLLAALKRLEFLSGRRLGRRHGPRVLDIDLLLYGDLLTERPELTLPHPRLRTREFVLVPLATIAPDWVVPPDGETVAELLGGLTGRVGLEPRRWSESLPPGSLVADRC